MPNRRTAAGAVAVSLPFLGGLTVLPAGAQTPAVTAPAAPTMISRQVDIKATIRVRPAGSTFVGRGTFTGKPFTSGKFGTRASVISRGPLRVRTTITLTTKVGQVILSATTSGSGSIVRGKANVVRGTGTYKGVMGSNLPVSFTSGTPSKVRLRGAVKLAVNP